MAYCEAADCFINSTSPRVATPRSFAAVLCPETLQPPHAPDAGGTATGRLRTLQGGGLPPTVPTQTRGSLRVVIECAGTYITFETFVCSLEVLLDQGPERSAGTGSNLRVGSCCLAGRLWLSGGDLRGPSSGGLLHYRSLRRSFTA